MTHTAQEIAKAYETLIEACRSLEAQDRLGELAIDEGWLGTCRCGETRPVDQMGEPCTGCLLIAAVDTIVRCGVCGGPVVELGWTLHHGRRGGDGIDTTTDADHAPVRVGLPGYCSICFAEITHLGGHAPVHVDQHGRPTDPCEEQQHAA